MAYISQYSGEVIDASIKNIVDDIYVNESGDTINGTLITKELVIQSDGQPSIRFRDENGNPKIGINTNETYNRFNFIQYGPDQSGYYEYYSFPNGTDGLTANKQYAILTKKNYLDMIYPIGSCYTTATNTNPSSTLGGTWELMDKKLSYQSGEATVTLNTTNASAATVYYIRGDHTIRLRIAVTNKVAINDTTTELLTVDISSIGVSSLNYGGYLTGRSDGGECIIEATISSAGVLSVGDVVPVADGGTWTASTAAQFEFVTIVGSSSMNDSACNQFIWQRTA